jgi:hypothetical protein
MLAWFVAAAPAHATDQSVDLSGGFAVFFGATPLLDGGDDVITFTNLAPGIYDVFVTMQSDFVPDFAGNLNGQPLVFLADNGITRFLFLDCIATAPLVLTLTGTPIRSDSSYRGELTVTLVPESGTLALLLVGLAGIGAVGRRR